MVEKAGGESLFDDEEDQYVFNIMHKIIPSEDFNIHVLLPNLNKAMNRKNRAAIDLLINSLYQIKEQQLNLIDFYMPQLW
jgi:hypothetical protein